MPPVLHAQVMTPPQRQEPFIATGPAIPVTSNPLPYGAPPAPYGAQAPSAPPMPPTGERVPERRKVASVSMKTTSILDNLNSNQNTICIICIEQSGKRTEMCWGRVCVHKRAQALESHQCGPGSGRDVVPSPYPNPRYPLDKHPNFGPNYIQLVVTIKYFEYGTPFYRNDIDGARP